MDLLCFVVVSVCLYATGVRGGAAGPQDRPNLCTGDSSSCIQPGKSHTCSGRGSCICGTCQCDSHRGDIPLSYTGQWCECDNSLCPSYNGAVCGGTQNGVCDCGFCKCFGNYTGKDCRCSVHTDKCQGQDGNMCGGHGKCVCNKCKCDEGYEGERCSICKDCKICDLNKECVQCIAHSKEQSQCRKECQHLDVEVVEDLPKTPEAMRKRTEVRCNYEDVAFVVETDGNKQIKVKAAKLTGNDDNNHGSSLSGTPFAVIICLYVLAAFLS